MLNEMDNHKGGALSCVKYFRMLSQKNTESLNAAKPGGEGVVGGQWVGGSSP